MRNLIAQAYNQVDFLRKSSHNKFFNFQSVCDDFNIPISTRFETYYLPVLAIGCIHCSLIGKTLKKHEGPLRKNEIAIREDFRKLLEGVEKKMDCLSLHTCFNAKDVSKTSINLPMTFKTLFTN